MENKDFDPNRDEEGARKNGGWRVGYIALRA